MKALINKPHFNDGDEVEIAMEGDVNNIIHGIIRGIAVENIIDQWIIESQAFKEKFGYPYSCAVIPHTFLRKKNSNLPFPCEPEFEKI